MKTIVLAEHSLLPGRRPEFDEVFKTHLAEVSRFLGFVSLKKLTEQSDADIKPCVLLEFSNQDLLLIWRQSAAHQNIAKGYEACWASPVRVRIFKIEN